MKYLYDDENRLLVAHQKGFEGDVFVAEYARSARLKFERMFING